jgi:hypothetical protein
MGFTKLDSGIVDSSVWSEPATTRVVWITFLAKCNSSGFVSASHSGMQRSCNVSSEEFLAAIKTLESPDPDSRTPDNDGRRIEKCDGGWIVLNYKKYREFSYSDNPESVRKREYRNKEAGRVPICPENVRDISASASASASEIQEGEVKKHNDYTGTWRENSPEGFKKYLEISEPEFDALYTDWSWIAGQKRFFPGCSVKRTLDRMWEQYWGTEAGWKNKRDSARGKKDYKINWKATIERTFKFSICYYGKNEIDDEAEYLKTWTHTK